MINIQLEDGTILDKTKLEKENGDKKEKMSPTVEERVILITLDSGEVMKPTFTCLEELKPPTWSVFHKNGKEKDNEIKIIKEIRPESSSNINQDKKRNSVTGLETSVRNCYFS